jgi:hypothetical protein
VLRGSWTEYEPHVQRERAILRRNPLLAPHGLLQDLKTGDVNDAINFVRKFGPLGYLDGQPPAAVKIGLASFWAKQVRFRLIAHVWESRNDIKQLDSSWKEIKQHRSQAERWQDPLKLPTDEWIRGHPSTRRSAVFELVGRELNLHTAGSATAWIRSGVGFRPILRVSSLWSVIWEFLGLDTATISWRRCPHCQRLFYPRRRDQFYCTPRQQALASKRNYIARIRAQERKRRKSRHR